MSASVYFCFVGQPSLEDMVSVAHVIIVKMALHPSIFQPTQPCQGKRRGKKGYAPFFNRQNLIVTHIPSALILLARLVHMSTYIAAREPEKWSLKLGGYHYIGGQLGLSHLTPPFCRWEDRRDRGRQWDSGSTVTSPDSHLGAFLLPCCSCWPLPLSSHPKCTNSSTYLVRT